MLIKAGQFAGRAWDNARRRVIEARVYGSGKGTHCFECHTSMAAFHLAVEHLNRIPHALWAELAERPDAATFVPDFVAAFIRYRVLLDEADATERRLAVSRSQAAALQAAQDTLDAETALGVGR
jgi:hypothetical protein